MARYSITTLVDITRTNPQRTDVDPIHLAQQANFDSLIQAIGIRSNVEWERDPKKITGRLPNGAGKATHWVWEFTAERDEIFLKGDNPVGLLLDDLNGVPIIDNLENSEELIPAAFQTVGDQINTWLSML